MVIIPFLNNCFSLTKKLVCSSAIHCASHIRFGMYFKIPEMRIYFNVFETLHGHMNSLLDVDADKRIEKMGSALYYAYFLGWHTGFIRMPYFSIQDLLSALPYTVPDPDGKGRSDSASVLQALNNRENLRRYQSLASLFVDESDDRFTLEHFGFLTPDEARERYRNEYSARFDAYFGRTLGVFLQELPPEYRQQ